MQQQVNHSVAKSRDIAGNIAFIERASQRPQSAKQKALNPLRPLFDACHNRGLKITPENRLNRLRAVNLYLHSGGLDQFKWLENSFKELIGDTAAILVLADAVQVGALKW